MLEGMPACVEGAMLAKMADRGRIKGCYIDGPLALDVAISKEVVEIKKLEQCSRVTLTVSCSPTSSRLMFYKVNSQLSVGVKQAAIAAVQRPLACFRRADSIYTKLNSIALAALTAK